MRKCIVPTLFLAVAIALAVGTFVGGDTSIVCGWLWLIWTIPFGAIWQFYGYDLASHLAPPHVLQYLGSALVILLCYFFWFVALPIVRRARRT